MGADVVSINDKPDGVNINEGCGSLHIDLLRKAVKLHKADIGIAHDGDADRTILCDEKGNMVDGDKVMGMWAVEMKRSHMMSNDTVVSTDFATQLTTTGNLFAGHIAGFLVPGTEITGAMFSTTDTPIPEPCTLFLFCSGLIGLAGYGRKKFFKK